jgi:putative selenate reductase
MPLVKSAPTWRIEGGVAREGPAVEVVIEETHQLATFVDFCNACGNCDVFCPEDGGPYVMKPHWFGSRAAFEAEARIDGFYLESKDAIAGRMGGRFVRLALDRPASLATFESEGASVSLRIARSGVELAGYSVADPSSPVEVRGDQAVILAALLEGVLSTVNPISAAFSAAERPPHALSVWKEAVD